MIMQPRPLFCLDKGSSLTAAGPSTMVIWAPGTVSAVSRSVAGFARFPGLSLLVSALFRWPCSISIHLSPRSVTGGVRPFPLAMQHFYSFVI